jgi:hypothetical protein
MGENAQGSHIRLGVFSGFCGVNSMINSCTMLRLFTMARHASLRSKRERTQRFPFQILSRRRSRRCLRAYLMAGGAGKSAAQAVCDAMSGFT